MHWKLQNATSFRLETSRIYPFFHSFQIYPIAASTVALTTKEDGTDDTFWLTYWSCFSLLFLCMDYLENFVGGIPGFYSVCMAATIYLFLPLFDGANVVFRS